MFALYEYSYPCLIVIVCALVAVADGHPYKGFIHYSSQQCLSQPALVCNFHALAGNSVEGYVIFKPVFRSWRIPYSRCRVLIQAQVTGLTPGPHGFHIHTYGDERISDGSAMSGHFAGPENKNIAHGYPRDSIRHWGDFGNLIADSKGAARYRRIDRLISLNGVVGRGMVIHADKDLGGGSQPSGNSGARQATCVIGFANRSV